MPAKVQRKGAAKKRAAVKKAAKSPTKSTLDNSHYRVEIWPLNKITPYEGNARRIPHAAIEKVATSLQSFGWQQPIVVDDKGVILAGHTRLLAADHLNLTEAPVHVATGLTPAQARAYRLMDNRATQETEWDYELLRPELMALADIEFDLKLTGFDLDELGRFLEVAPDVQFREYDESVAGEVKYQTCPQCGHVFPK